MIQEVVEVKRPVVLLTLLAILASLLLSGISDGSASVTDTSIPDDEVTASTGGNNSSASATITITMTTVCLPDE